MEQNYSKKKPPILTDGPCDLSVKRILAFSKAFKTLNTSEESIKPKE